MGYRRYPLSLPGLFHSRVISHSVSRTKTTLFHKKCSWRLMIEVRILSGEHKKTKRLSGNQRHDLNLAGCHLWFRSPYLFFFLVIESFDHFLLLTSLNSAQRTRMLLWWPTSCSKIHIRKLDYTL